MYRVGQKTGLFFGRIYCYFSAEYVREVVQRIIKRGDIQRIILTRDKELTLTHELPFCVIVYRNYNLLNQSGFWPTRHRSATMSDGADKWDLL